MKQKAYNFIWLLKYAYYFKKKTGWSFKDSWNYGKASLYDLLNGKPDKCDTPKNQVDEDISCWSE